jgi:hypothetical protein
MRSSEKGRRRLLVEASRRRQQPYLFGEWNFIRERGRTGHPDQVTEREAQATLDRQRRAKQRRGYT